jgi:hypothetical protein
MTEIEFYENGKNTKVRKLRVYAENEATVLFNFILEGGREVRVSAKREFP